VIFIDLKSKLPTLDVPGKPGWKAWTQEKWDAWLEESKQLVAQLAKYSEAGDLTARNQLIDAKSSHWGELKPWLLALSDGKCWFTEARDICSHYDVEHFRPKKIAKELDGTERDGYWWLAFDYMNFRVCGSVPNRMKGGWFPLRAGSLRSSYAHRCEESEDCYLLDPTKKSDVLLLGFDEEGKAISDPGNAAWNEERVAETLKRLKLNDHPALAEERRKVWQRTHGLIESFREKARISHYNLAVQAALDATLDELLRSIQREAELSAVARYCVRLNCPEILQLA
jgi:hypothetical protein